MIMNINEVDVKKWNSSFHTKFTGSGKLDLKPKTSATRSPLRLQIYPNLLTALTFV